MARQKRVQRITNETQITVEIDLDGSGASQISTGIGFLDHMLTAFAKHSGFDLTVAAVGDTHIDDHHTSEDVAITLGQAFKEALGDKIGIARYGHSFLPMDETLVRTALDISNRPYYIYNVSGLNPKVGSFDTELIGEFWRAFALNAGITLHIDLLRGAIQHHIVESIFKSLALALKGAVRIVGRDVPSTKGVL